MDILTKLPRIKEKGKKRKGRGLSSGKGAKSTRGGKRHQKAREKIPLHFEGGQAKIIKKYPLLRGKGKNKSVKKSLSINLDLLNEFIGIETVDRKALIKKGILGKSDKNVKVKVVSTGKLEKKLTIKLPVSKTALKKIQAAGGKVEQP